MNNRLLEIIKYATNGKQVEFANIMGWKPQYITKCLREGMGIKPIIALLEKFPELNARWLILGEGTMLDASIEGVKKHLMHLLQIEKYMPVMTADEQQRMLAGEEFNEEDILRWQDLLDKKNEDIMMRYIASIKKQQEYADRTQSNNS